MRFFCVKQIYPNGKCDDMVKIILQTPPEIRTDEDHNKVFACFHHDVYLNTIQKTRDIAKLLLAVSVLEGKRLDSNQTLEIQSIQYAVVVQGKLKVGEKIYEQKSCILKKDLVQMQGQKIYNNGSFIVFLTSERYKQLLEFNLEEIKQKVESLKKFGLFKEITHTHLLYLASNTQSQTFTFRQYVYRLGDQPLYIYCILNGTFEVIRYFSPKPGNVSSVTSVQPGQSFGQDCVFLHKLRQAQIKSLSSDSLVLRVPSQSVLDVYGQYSKLRISLIQTINSRISLIHNRSIDMQSLSRLKNKSLLASPKTISFPKIQQKIDERQRMNFKFQKQKTNQQVGMQLIHRIFNFSKYKLLDQEKPIKNSKQDILRSLGADYLVKKLQRQQSLSQFSKNAPQNLNKSLQLKSSFVQFPLIQSTKHQLNKPKNVKKNLHRHYKKQQTTQNYQQPNTQFSINKMFSLHI